MKVVLCIGGLDPAGRAGLLADARAIEAQGAQPICVAAALTFQSTRRVAGYEAVAPDILARQIETILADEPVAAVKIGLIGSAANAATIDRLLPKRPVVLDTPLVSTSGADLFPRSDIASAYRPLIAHATLVTPNAVEVFLLAGQSQGSAVEAARSLDASAVLLKGGHLPGDGVEDVLIRPGHLDENFQGVRLPGTFRGTGCRLASAIAARLALGEGLVDAIAHARAWLVETLAKEIASAAPIGR